MSICLFAGVEFVSVRASILFIGLFVGERHVFARASIHLFKGAFLCSEPGFVFERLFRYLYSLPSMCIWLAFDKSVYPCITIPLSRGCRWSFGVSEHTIGGCVSWLFRSSVFRSGASFFFLFFFLMAFCFLETPLCRLRPPSGIRDRLLFSTRPLLSEEILKRIASIRSLRFTFEVQIIGSVLRLKFEDQS